MRGFRETFSNLVSKVRNLFTQEQRQAQPKKSARLKEIESKPLYQFFHRMSIWGSKRHARAVVWCQKFNRRNNHIVPEKSPLSIYLKAVKPRRRIA